jgi:hypothetical protein
MKMISRIHLVSLARSYFKENLDRVPKQLLKLLESFEKDPTMSYKEIRVKLLSMGIDETLVNNSFPEVISVENRFQLRKKLMVELFNFFDARIPWCVIKLLDGLKQGIVFIDEIREALLWEFPELRKRETLVHLLTQQNL